MDNKEEILRRINELAAGVEDIYEKIVSKELTSAHRNDIVLLKSRIHYIQKLSDLAIENNEIDLINQLEKIENDKGKIIKKIESEQSKGIGQINSSMPKKNPLDIHKDFVREIPVILKAQGVSKKYDEKFSLNELSLNIRAGEITGIVGGNGFGKTTLLKIITGLLKSDSGKVIYNDYSDKIEDLEYWSLVKSKVGYLPQDVPIKTGNVIQNLQLSASISGVTGDENKMWVDYYLHRFGLWNDRDKTIRALAGGQRLRFALAEVLIKNPSVIVLDEPLANLDVNMKTTLLNDIKMLAVNPANPMGIVITSHDLMELEKVAGNMIVLNNGKVEYQGKTVDIGRDEDTNVFEIETSLRYFELIKKMRRVEGIKVESRITSFIIYTPKTITAKELLKHFIENDVIPESFVDLSNSSKRMLIKMA